jgi:ataxin-3
LNEQELSEIALRLDDAERVCMAEAGIDTADFRAFAAEESGNVSLDGNFSLTVLQEALRVWGLACTPFASKTEPEAAAARAAPVAQRGFLLNLDRHWYSIRRIGVEWFNFNSLLAAPQPVSDTYLALMLQQLQVEGWSIFVVTGAWQARGAMRGEASADGVWLSRSQAAALCADAARDKAAARTRTAAQTLFSRAAQEGGKLTLRAWGGGADAGDDPDLAKALAASLGEADVGWVSSGAPPSRPRERPASPIDEDEALARAIAASLDEPEAKRRPAAVAAPAEASPPPDAQPAPLPREPAPGDAGAIQLALRLPNGTRLTRYFFATDTVEDVAAVAAAAGIDMTRHTLSSGFPPRALAPRSATLAELGVSDKALVTAQPA